MQEEILEHYPSAGLHVYAVWFPMLFGDALRRWDQDVIADQRVIHFWDQERLAGRWFAEHVEGYSGIVWDAYYLYGPEATWGLAPGPLVSSGATILREREELRAHIVPLLSTSNQVASPRHGE